MGVIIFNPMLRSNRQKINFMVDKDLIIEIKTFVPEGERSNFVNNALEEALDVFKRKRASEEMDKLRESLNIKMSTKEMLKLKNYGRK